MPTIHTQFEKTGQGYRLQHIEKTKGIPALRFTIRLDTSYPEQSSVYVEHLTATAGWVRDADLYPESFADAPSAYKRDADHRGYAQSLIPELRDTAYQLLA
jgi:hypothetical protein